MTREEIDAITLPAGRPVIFPNAFGRMVYEIRLDEIEIDVYNEGERWWYSTRLTLNSHAGVRSPIPQEEPKSFPGAEAALEELRAELKFNYVKDSN
jgi:hypothetical protein